MSTNKVYGDAPNELPLVELETRWDYADAGRLRTASTRRCRIDATPAQPLRRVEGRGRRDGAGVRPLLRHADGLLPRRLPHRPEPLRRRAARLPRLPGAVRSARAAPTGSTATRASRCATTSTRYDVCAAFMAFYESPRVARGLQPRRRPREQRVDARGDRAARGAASARSSTYEYVDQNRVGDHICYISDLRRLQADYPGWDLTRSLDDILDELAAPPAS